MQQITCKRQKQSCLREALLVQAPWIACSFNQTMSRDFLQKGLGHQMDWAFVNMYG
jgi:hypothetical protein